MPYPQERRSLNESLATLAAEEPLTGSAWQQLEAEALGDALRAKAFGITPANVEAVLEARSQLFRSVYPDVLRLCQKKGISQQPHFLEIFWNLWLPLAMQLAASRQQLKRPLIQGILGGQGTGKTTLAAILKLILGRIGYRALGLSVDDFYKTYAERQRLQAQDPRLIWRGPPGTHDVELAIAVLDQLRQSQPSGAVQIPRFDKSAWGGEGDRMGWEEVEGVDIVLFEGWFVGVRPLAPEAFETAPPPIVTPSDRAFARDMNAKLEDYLPLWERLDRLMLLYPADYRLSQQWRRQAEREMMAAGRAGMTDERVGQFVEYFWKALHPKLFIEPMVGNLNWVDLVIEIDADRTSGVVYRPSDRLP